MIWVHPDDCDAPHALDMTSPYNFNKVKGLEHAFIRDGFGLNFPALVGYPLDNRIQLLSGTHRHLAAKQAGTLLPVTMWLRSDIELAWGTEMWNKVMEDIPVRDLQ